jgi:nucleotide-binding universal stress UspA family protein
MMEYRKFKKVLFCTDFSENADYAFEFAHSIAKGNEGFLYILHVIPDNPRRAYVTTYIDQETLEELDQSVKQDVGNSHKEHYVNKIENGIPFEVVTKMGREDEEIIEFAEQVKADIIVLGTHGRTGIQRVLFGSVAEKVLRHSPYPVFVIPCKRKREFPTTIYLYRGREGKFVKAEPKQ